MFFFIFSSSELNRYSEEYVILLINIRNILEIIPDRHCNGNVAFTAVKQSLDYCSKIVCASTSLVIENN